MVQVDGGQAEPPKKSDFWTRCGKIVEYVNQKFAYFIGLPIVTVIGTLLAAHFQYVSAYHDRVRAAGKEQLAAAEAVFTDASTAFSKAITLQQTLYANYHAALTAHRENDPQSLEVKTARVVYPEYDAARTSLRETIDLLTRRVELSIDWASDIGRDAAHAGNYGADPMTRIALGGYNFDCDVQANMPTFTGKTQDELQARDDNGKIDPKRPTIIIDWYSAKHQLLTLFYCFEIDHERIKAAREWAVGAAVAPSKLSDEQIRESLDREALRLHAFLTLAARQIEVIHVKFRPRKWYCEVPIVRQIYDAYSLKCSPIRTAQSASSS